MKLENVTNSQTLNEFDLHALDSVVEINRDVDVGIHLPQDIIGKGAEFSEIRRVENRELTKLWQQMNRVLKNSFIHLADKIGIKAYENLIDDLSVKGNLEDKRKIIYALWNMVTIWTHRTLEDWLESWLGHKNLKINIKYNEYEINFEIFVSDKNVDLSELFFILRYKILPANLVINISVSFATQLRIITQKGDLSYPTFLCGEHKCGDIPRRFFEGEKIESNVVVNITEYSYKNEYIKSGETKSGRINMNLENTEFINVQDLSNIKVYEFRE